jgi:hypothetical protein
MACPEFSPDFYNNVAAVAVVLMFAKVVTHRSRKAHHGPEWTSILAGFHIVAVLAAIVTVVVCLKATDSGSDTDHVWRNTAWVFLALTGGILAIDVIADAFCDAHEGRRKSCKCTAESNHHPNNTNK